MRIQLILLISLLAFVQTELTTQRPGVRLRSVRRTNRMRMIVKRLSTLQPTTTSTTTAEDQVLLNDDKIIKNILNVTVNVGDNVRFKCEIDEDNRNNGVSTKL